MPGYRLIMQGGSASGRKSTNGSGCTRRTTGLSDAAIHVHYGNRTGQASSGMSMIVGTVVTLMVMIVLALFAVVMLMGVLVLMLMRMTLRRAVRVRMRMLVRMFVSAFHRTLPG